MKSPAEAIAHGIVYLTEDRKRDGLFADLPVLNNASAAALASLSRLGIVDRREERRRVQPVLQRLRVVAASMRVPVRALSGGNQQKVLFGTRPARRAHPADLRRADARRRRRAREEIYPLIDALAREGVTIVLISSDLKELSALCHRLLVIRDAAVVAELPAGASEADIVDAAIARAPHAA